MTATPPRSLASARWPWVVLVALLAGSLAVAALGDPGPRTTAERARAIAESIKCPTCQGQSVADSDATAARSIRTEIARRLEAGETDDEIRDYIAGLYGESSLLTPPRSGVAGLIWFLPVAGIVLGAGGLALWFRPAPERTTPQPSDRGAEEQAQPSNPWPRRVVAGAALAAVAVGAGVLVAQSSGRRGSNVATGLDVTAASERVGTCLTLEREEPSAGLDCYTSILDELPANVEALTFRGWLQVRSFELDDGLADLDAAIQLAPEATSAYIFRASGRMRAGDPRGALADLAAFVEGDPGDDELALAEDLAATVVATALDRCISGEVDGTVPVVEAAQCYQNALVVDPGNAVASVYLGWLFARSGVADADALDLLDAGLDADPRLSAGYVFRAALRAHLGDLDGASADLALFETLDPPEDQLVAAAQVRAALDAGEDPLARDPSD